MTPFAFNAYNSWSTATVTTSTTGSSFVPLSGLIPVPAQAVTIVLSSTDVAIDMKQASAPDTDFVKLDAPSGLVIPLGGLLNEVQVRRNDQSNTPVTVRFIWLKVSR